jgi:hypothetical protein
MKSLIVAVLALSVAGGAQAESPKALVRADSGEVKVAGRSVEKAQSSGAEAGDVVAVTGGEARVTYSNGCTVKVTDSYTVEKTPPAKCAALVTAGSSGNHGKVGAGIAIAAGALALASGGSDRGKASQPRSSSP